ncbi:Nuclear receptor HR96 variant 1, partial [Operophtera brumata]
MEENSDKKDETSSQKKELPSNLQKTCLVCGDKALGYNFNAISCESCKAFFRRNALTSKELKCPFTNNCVITVVTRRFCQKCRLEKCLSVGMVKEFIMSDEDKAEKRRKIEENRARKRQSNDTEDSVSSSKNLKRDDESSNYTPSEPTQYNTLNSTSCSPSSTSIQSPVSNDVDSSLPPYNYPPMPPIQPSQPYMKVFPIDEKSVINRATYDQRIMDQYTYDSVNSNSYMEPPKQNSIRSLLTNGDSKVYPESKPQHVCEDIPSTSSTDPDVNKARDILQDVERAKLNELIVANKSLNAPVDDDMS